jgi:hypothetical protein
MSEASWKLAVAESVIAGGPEVITELGGTVSTVKVTVGGSPMPSVPKPRTWKTWVPSARFG